MVRGFHLYFRPVLNAFYTIRQTTVLPLIFKIFSDYEDNNITKDTLCKVLDYLLTYFVRITACEINKNLSKFMKTLYDRVIDNNYDDYYEHFVSFLNNIRANDRMPTDKEFNMGNSNQKRYRAKEIKFNGTDIFVSTQFFDADRDAVIEWYKCHLN